MKNAIKLALAVTAAACTTLPISVSHAQDGADSTIALDEVIVSARKRDESLQDVPIAVDVFSEAALKQLSINNVDSLARYTPSLTYDQGVLPMDTRPVIRGASAQRGRPNVGILVDYVDVSSEALTVAGGGVTSNLRLLDLERVEIVKGPQNALYGRSAFTGAVNYVTKRPSDTFEADVSVDWNEHDANELGFSVAGPLIDDVLNARVAFSQLDDPGVYRNPNTGDLLGSLDSVGGSLALDWQFAESANAYFRYERSNDDAAPRAEVFVQALTPEFDPMVNPFGTGTVTDAAVQYPHMFPGVVCNGIDRLQPNFDSFGAGPPCRALVTGQQHATESMIDLSPDPRTGSDFIGSEINNTRIHFDIDAQFDDIRFRYILGYSDNNAFVQEDFDKTNNSIISVPFGPFPFSQYGLSAMSQQTIATQQRSHEIRVSGETERADWMVSMLHWSETMNAQFDDQWWLREGGNAGLVLGLLNNGPGAPFNFLQQPVGPFPDFCALIYPGNPACIPMVTSLATGPGNTPFIPLQRKTIHTSVAAMVNLNLRDNLTLSLEGRFLDEEIDYAGDSADVSFYSQFGADPWWGFNFGPGEMTTNTVEEDTFVPKVTLDWGVGENTLVYGNYSQAFKPGGVSTTDANGDVSSGEYKSEELDAYEVGIKTEFRDRSIRFNAAAFFYDYTDQQVPFQFISPTTGLLQTSVINAGETEIKGFEVDLTWNSAVVDGLSANLSYTHTDAEFTSFNQADILAASGGAPSTFNRVKAGNADGDFTGKTPPLTSEDAATASIRYDAFYESGKSAFIQLLASYSSERFIGEDNLSWLPDYTLVDLYMGLAGDHWAATLYVKNAGDDDTIRSGLGNIDYGLLPDGRSPPQGLSLYLPDPRTAGLRIDYRFGD